MIIIESCLCAKHILFSEKYTRGVSAVESILTLDRLRQSVAVKELEQARGQPITMRKTASVPNFSQVIAAIQIQLYSLVVKVHNNITLSFDESNFCREFKVVSIHPLTASRPRLHVDITTD